ncbi:hypothetical protein HPB51_019203 [Rhipicephalus microplus]|uniref:Uncharacterized protein n=1 Tax=Rhipicephalus microplus TaxID=6941 RepID=A0A9J6EB68_RHIMP|nr:hypothetical protein HPB51_019203 [Rhipicephalus microplus]
MVSAMVTSAAVALFALSLAVLYFAQPADDALAAEALLGDWREDESSLPPVFVDFSETRDRPLDVPEAILKAKRMGAHGIRIYLNLSIEGPVNWDLLLNKKPAVVEEMYESLRRHDVRLMLQVEDHDGRTAKFVSYLFRLWPDMSRRVVVASSSPLFLLTLGGNNKAIVKALVWCPCSVAYTDAMCTRPRNDNLGWHLVASAADWFYRWCFGWGLLTRASMASAVVVDMSHVNECFVRLWRDRGLRVVVVASDDPKEQEYLRQVLRVPIVANYGTWQGRE